MRRFACLVLVFALPSAGHAQPTSAPAPGKCSYIQPQVKQCSVSTEKGVGTFDVIVSPPAGLVITFEEPLVGMQPPPSSSYKAIFSGSTATVVPLRRDPIQGATVHFDTASVHVTLNLKLGGTPDTQLLILDPRKVERDAEVERRVKEALGGLEDRANQRAERILLEEMATGGVDVVDPDVDPSRHNQIVLRARKILRLGQRAFLVFTIDNRSGDDVELKALRLWHSVDGKEHELREPPYQLAAKTVLVNAEVTGVVAIPQKPAPTSGKLRLRVELSGTDRVVELGGIRLR